MKIAIIEDNSLMAEMLKDMVTEQPDWELVGIADNGDDGIGLIRAKRPDIVLLDLILPKSDGFFVLKTIRRGKHSREVSRAEQPQRRRAHRKSAPLRRVLLYDQTLPVRPTQRTHLRRDGYGFPQRSRGGAAAHVKSLDEKLSDIFLQLGMQIKLQGFHFVRDCIKIAARRPIPRII